MNNDFTIVVQGPLHERSLGNVHNYQKFGDVIISCWDTCDKSQLFGLGVELVVSSESDYDFTDVINPQNLYRQCITTLNGIRAAKTEYVIKVRSDEYYTDLSFIVDNLRANPSKIVVGNTFFGRKEWDFGDHLYAGQTDLMLATLTIMRGALRKKIPNFVPKNPNCEGYLFMSILRALGKENSTYKEAILDNIILAPSHYLGDFFVRSNSCDWNGIPSTAEDGYLTIHSFAHLE
jgi:hypothetical protein